MNPLKPGEKAELQPNPEADVAESLPGPPASTFVIRFWTEWSHGGLRWRGRIEHLQSGHSIAFAKLQRMLAFMRSLGLDDERGQDIE
jgi:hypothetical protein